LYIFKGVFNPFEKPNWRIAMIRFRFMILLCLLICRETAATREILYIYPKPGSDWLPRETVFLIRFADLNPAEILNKDNFIRMEGKISGPVSGKISLSDDRRTWICKSGQPFQPGEQVRVCVNCLTKDGDRLYDLETLFTIAPVLLLPENEFPHDAPKPFPLQKGGFITNEEGVILLNGVSVPSDFPFIDVFINDQPAPGAIFCNNWNWNGKMMYSLILDNSGAPLWYWRHNEDRRDLRVQQGLLTMRVRGGYGGGGYIALDRTYSVVDTFFAPPGYQMNDHDFQLLPNGHYLLIGNDERLVDLRPVGGEPNAMVLGNSLIEMDAGDLPVFIWRCWDYFPVLENVRDQPPRQQIDYVHMNSIDVDLDGNYVISCRHLSEITKINRETGDIIWRLGGRSNQFDWINDTDRISYQHDVRPVSGGHYTLFDNGDTHDPRYSRALELEVDPIEKRVRKVWEFRDSPDKYAWFAGNVQRLENGNTLINWGVEQLPRVTEVTPEGFKVYEMNFSEPAYSYRVFRFDWHGAAAKPYLVAELSVTRLTLIFNQFGASDIAAYQIFAGEDPDSLSFFAETTDPYAVIELDQLEQDQIIHFRVRTASLSGELSEFSNDEPVHIPVTQAGFNLIKNGDFASGIQDWMWDVRGGAEASPKTDGGLFQFEIRKGGTMSSDIQLYQNNLTLIEGQTYRFEFDAWADRPRIFEAKISSADSSANYSQSSTLFIRNREAHFAFDFIMNQPTLQLGRVLFNAGTDAADVYIDHVSLTRIEPTNRTPGPGSPDSFHLYSPAPNPFNSQTTLSYQLNRTGKVCIRIFDIRGREVKTFRNQVQTPGSYQIRFHGDQLSSGVYFMAFTFQGRTVTLKTVHLK
jgi:hypothetical protein